MEKKNQGTFRNWEQNHSSEIRIIRDAGYSVHDQVNQKYDGNKPYGFHLDMVAQNVSRFGGQICREECDLIPLFFAAYFHDSIEDARLTYNDVKKIATDYMDEESAFLATEIVYALTNDKGRTRKERAGEKYYRGIRETTYAPFMKMCDRMANMEYSFNGRNEANLHMKNVYKSEFEEFITSISAETTDIRFSLPTLMIEEIKKLME